MLCQSCLPLKVQVLRNKHHMHEEIANVLNKSHELLHKDGHGRARNSRKQIRQIVTHMRTLSLDIRQLHYQTVYLRKGFELALNDTKTNFGGRFEGVLGSISNMSGAMEAMTSRVGALEDGMRNAGIAVPTIEPSVSMRAVSTVVTTVRGRTAVLGCVWTVDGVDQPNISISWSKTDGVLPPESITESSNLIIHDADYSDGGMYLCRHSERDNDVTSTTVELIVKVPTLTMKAKREDISAYRGSKVVLECRITGDVTVAAPIYWTRFNGVLPVQSFINDGKLIICDAAMRDAGTYVCDVNITEIVVNPGVIKLQVKKESMVRVRLVGATGVFEGRVEVLYRNRWGTVCDDGWDDADARVACRMAGFTAGGVAKSKAYFGTGSGTIWLDDVNCTGNEDTLEECASNAWGDHSCYHQEDAGVICHIDLPFFGGLRLSGGRLPGEGRVEMNRMGVWGALCDEGWDDRDATVVCRMMGFNLGGYRNRPGAYGGTDKPAWMTNVRCFGDEPDIFQCGHRGWGLHVCPHDNHATVTCA
ncbi:scavenger receptor cysteine-rich type 1 protein M130-like [Pecten maximus]|uniref:scavenger receptor cysteine-rich type 1 protein M130-like n=1 Tax=Pecten maximus TaxID=6579 RepID=UPI0014591B7D|nr:scavenger receptor cysteine-rich type 1 protein M130-like [Pecten maximus]